jgi:putative heme-binding domain-containing protein
VPDELWGIGRRDIGLAADENYEQWRQTLGDDAVERRPKFWTAPGFEVTLVRAAAADEGSWIAMAFDDEGRLTVSREDRGLLRFTLDDDRASVTSVERFELPLEECRGLIYADGWLYANANNSRTVYRLKIGEDGSLKELASLRSFPGGVGHGRNDLAAHDGHLLSIHGDSVATPAEDVLDLTSPLRPTRRGDAGREGYLLRFDRAGREWEIVASGLRNPYGIAARTSGDLFTFDADNEFDMGTPWYRPTRIVQLLEGGDTGYREAGGQWPPRFHDQPENTPPVIDIGRSSPTSVMFGDSLAFPAPYRSALFALDWTYGRVIAVHLFPQGAGWRASTELFLQGRPLNVTDLAAGPDGAMYLITGGRKTQSALYRVAAIKPPAQPAQAVETSSIHAADANRFATTQRARRAHLARLARQLATAKPDTAKPDTAKPDAAKPDAAKPDTAKPDTAKPDTAKPDAAKPDTSKPDTSKPDTSKPDAAKPDAAKPDTVMLDEIWSALDDADPWVRHSARIALEHLPVDVWRPRVEQLAESPTRGATLRSLAGQLDALLALARAAQRTDRELLLRAATRIAPRDLPVGQRIVWARIVELSWTADLLALRDPLINHAVAAWPEPTAAPEIALEGSNRDLRRRLALLMARLQARQLPELAARDLLSSDSQEDRLAGLLALSDHRAGWTATLREAQFRTLGATADLVGGQGMPGFLERLRTASLATLGESERPALAKLAEPAAAPDEPPPPARPLVQTWTLEALLPLAVAGTGKAATTTAEAPTEAVEPTAAVARANAEARAAAVTRGERVFQAALCARCHRVGVRGPAIGPDLTHVAQRFSRRDILESIVRPSLSVSEIYRNSRVVTEDGKVYTGRVVSAGDYRSQTLKLNTDPLRPNQGVEVDKRTIAEFLELATSPMPEGLLNSFTRDEIADLLAFLEAGPSAASSKARGLP